MSVDKRDAVTYYEGMTETTTETETRTARLTGDWHTPQADEIATAATIYSGETIVLTTGDGTEVHANSEDLVHALATIAPRAAAWLFMATAPNLDAEDLGHLAEHFAGTDKDRLARKLFAKAGLAGEWE